jgi:hypothetical protein
MPPTNTSLAPIIAAQMVSRATAQAAHATNANRLGRRIVANYEASANKFPGGACFEVCYARVAEAAKQEGVPLPALNPRTPFGTLWGSFVGQRIWAALPDKYRAKGAPGAMAYAGLGTLLETTDVWSGKLLPGAVIQVWGTVADYQTARGGEGAFGHSFIFLNYVTTKSAITGMRVADQRWLGRWESVPRSEFQVWFGANHTSGDPPFIY